MIIELQGKEYPIRGSFRAIEECEQKEGIELHKVEGLVQTGKLLYYCAKNGAKHEGQPFKISVSEWLDLIEVRDMDKLKDALNYIMGIEPDASTEEKKS